MYNFKDIEKKWQNYWDINKTFKVVEDDSKKKYYMLVEFPYPSGAGLHVGHARCFTASDTLKMWKTVREGEEKYVFPHQDDADRILNSAHIYELGILKTYAEPLLFAVEETDDNYAEALRLINFLRNFLPIPSDYIPSDSILREFIGRSCFFK